MNRYGTSDGAGGGGVAGSGSLVVLETLAHVAVVVGHPLVHHAPPP